MSDVTDEYDSELSRCIWECIQDALEREGFVLHGVSAKRDEHEPDQIIHADLLLGDDQEDDGR